MGTKRIIVQQIRWPKKKKPITDVRRQAEKKNAHPQSYVSVPLYFQSIILSISYEQWIWCMTYEAQDENSHKLQLFHRRQYILLHFNVFTSDRKMQQIWFDHFRTVLPNPKHQTSVDFI